MRGGARLVAALVILATILGGGGGAVPRAAAATAGDWLPTTAPPAPPGTLRFRGLVPLASGLILAYEHGYGPTSEGYFYRASFYDPALETWSAARPFDPQGGNDAPVALADGRALFTGGNSYLGCINPGCAAPLATAQIFDPAKNAWAAVAPMPVARLAHCATRLPDDTVLVVGGFAPNGRAGQSVKQTVRYDPRTDRWEQRASSDLAHTNCAAITLRDGRVLVLGNRDSGSASIELYDPAADRWSVPSAPPNVPPSAVYATTFPTLLPDGRVFVFLNAPGSAYFVGAALYDPGTGRWTEGAVPSFRPSTVTSLTDGRILATGEKAEIYDPASGRWDAVAPPPLARVWTESRAEYDTIRASWAAAPLPGGGALLVAGDAAATFGDPARPRACFAETGRCLSGRFLDYWRANGGLAANGFPLTDPLAEELEDGRTYTVQYFERVRLEFHPENPPPHNLQLGQFGRRIHPAAPPVAPLPDARFFPQTGHNLAGAFRDRWEAEGGLERFGYPLGEVETETLEDGRTYRVQYFERARLEYHPENAAPYDVLAGQFGRRILGENRWLAQDPALKRRYLTDPTLQATLGAPLRAVAHNDLEFQAFEHGAVLLVLGGEVGGVTVGTIAYVLCDGTPAAGASARAIIRQPDYGPPPPVPAPGPGLYLPVTGIGDLWLRDASVRECLGYATAPAPTGTARAARGVFAGGVLFGVTTPDGPALYAIYGTPTVDGLLDAGRYARLP